MNPHLKKNYNDLNQTMQTMQTRQTINRLINSQIIDKTLIKSQIDVAAFGGAYGLRMGWKKNNTMRITFLTKYIVAYFLV